jgi:hypothetical protein
MSNQKFNEHHVRLCDQEGCELPATHTYVWDRQLVACRIHAQGVLNIANAMGFPTPAATMRLMTIDEMAPDED